jgi:hypothetical protein
MMMSLLFDDFNVLKLEKDVIVLVNMNLAVYLFFYLYSFFFKPISCINMKLEFYVTLVLLDFVVWFSWPSMNSHHASATKPTNGY